MAGPSSRNDSPFGGPAEEDSAIISVGLAAAPQNDPY